LRTGRNGEIRTAQLLGVFLAEIHTHNPEEIAHMKSIFTYVWGGAILLSGAVCLAVPPTATIVVSGNGLVISQGNNPTADTDAGTNFGVLPVSATGHAHVFSFTNGSNGNLKVDSVTIAGSNPSDFIIAVPPANLNVGHGSSEPFTVVFNPSAVGLRTAVITFVSNDPANPTYSINIAGTGLPSQTSAPDLRVVLKAKPKYSSATPGIVTLKGKATIYNVGTTTSLAGSLHILHGSGLPLDGSPSEITSVPFVPIPAPLPGKKPKKTKVSFSVTFASSDHAAFVRATPNDSDLDATDNFVSMDVEPK
jgi:hypothetical protein